MKEVIYDFDYVVNCAGVLIQGSADDPDRAMLLNAYLPQYLASCLSSSSTKLIHLSTDCVFSGSRFGGYGVDEIPDEKSIYGYSKSLGEVNNKKDLTLRMSYVGPELSEHASGLLDWFLKLDTGSVISGWKNHYWSGITTLELAKIIEIQITSGEFFGLHNLVKDNFRISKFELLQSFQQVFEKDVTVKPLIIKKVLIKVCFGLYQ